MKVEDVRAFIQTLPIKYHVTPVGMKAQQFSSGQKTFKSISGYMEALRTMENPEEARVMTRCNAEKCLLDAIAAAGGTKFAGMRALLAVAYILQSMPEVKAIIDAVLFADIHRIKRLRKWADEQRFRLVPEEDTPDAYRD